jgi:hypothetical protein
VSGSRWTKKKRMQNMMMKTWGRAANIIQQYNIHRVWNEV